MDSGEVVALRLEVDGDGVVRVTSEAEVITLTPRELGRVLTVLMSALVAQEGDDEQQVNLN